MLEKASALFSSRGANLQSYIYGTSALANGQRTDKVRIAPLAVHRTCIAAYPIPTPDDATGKGQTFLTSMLSMCKLAHHKYILAWSMNKGWQNWHR